MLCCGAVCGGDVQEGTVPLVRLLAGFKSLPLFPTSKFGPSGADSQVDGFVYIVGPCGSLQWTLLWGWEFILLPQPPQVFPVRGFEVLFSHIGSLCCAVCLAPLLSLPVYPYENVGLPSLPAAASPDPILQPPPCCEFSPPWLPISTPPTSLDESFFNSLVVGLPYVSIFWKFWLFFVFKFVVVLLLVVWGGKVYLPMPPSWPEVSFQLLYFSIPELTFRFFFIFLFLLSVFDELLLYLPLNFWFPLVLWTYL